MTDEWSAWVGDLRVAGGSGGSGQALYYARQYADEGEVIVRKGMSKRGKIIMRVAHIKTGSVMKWQGESE